MKLPAFRLALLLAATAFSQAQEAQVKPHECTVMGTTHPYVTLDFFQWRHSLQNVMIPDLLAQVTQIKAGDKGQCSVVLPASTYDVLVAEPGYYPKAFRLSMEDTKPCPKPITMRLRRDKSVHYE